MLWFSKTSLINYQILSYSSDPGFTAFKSGFKNGLQIIILVFLQFIVIGCDSVNHFIKAEPASHAGFLPAPELLSEMRQRYPFHGVWMNMNIEDFDSYNCVYIAPMDTSHLADNDWWDDEVAVIVGQNLSLNDIEHKILRPIWQEPRIHYAVNRASYGCPNLSTKVFTSAKTNTLLDQAAQDYINHPRGVSFKNGRLSRIEYLSWV